MVYTQSRAVGGDAIDPQQLPIVEEDPGLDDHPAVEEQPATLETAGNSTSARPAADTPLTNVEDTEIPQPLKGIEVAEPVIGVEEQTLPPPSTEAMTREEALKMWVAFDRLQGQTRQTLWELRDAVALARQTSTQIDRMREEMAKFREEIRQLLKPPPARRTGRARSRRSGLAATSGGLGSMVAATAQAVPATHLVAEGNMQDIQPPAETVGGSRRSPHPPGFVAGPTLDSSTGGGPSGGGGTPRGDTIAGEGSSHGRMAPLVPSFDWNLRNRAEVTLIDKWEGVKGDCAIEQWLSQAEGYLRATNCPPDAWVNYAYPALRGQAFNIFQYLQEKIGTDWSLFCAELRWHFGVVNPNCVAWEKYYSLRQTGSVQEFIRAVRETVSLITKDKPSPASQFYQIWFGLKPHLQDLLRLNPNTSKPWVAEDAELFYDTAIQADMPISVELCDIATPWTSNCGRPLPTTGNWTHGERTFKGSPEPGERGRVENQPALCSLRVVAGVRENLGTMITSTKGMVVPSHFDS